MAPNPSHLEFVDPVVAGHGPRRRRGPPPAGPPRQDEVASLAVLIHGDASFPGQGIVAETLNLSRLPGYRTGGTLHLIANNQLGFTTEPRDGRSTLYASDLAKGSRSRSCTSTPTIRSPAWRRSGWPTAYRPSSAKTS